MIRQRQILLLDAIQQAQNDQKFIEIPKSPNTWKNRLDYQHNTSSNSRGIETTETRKNRLDQEANRRIAEPPRSVKLEDIKMFSLK